MLYVGLFLFLVLLQAWSRGNVALRSQLYWGTLASLYGFAAFRYEVGCDWSGYLNQFDRYSAMQPSDEFTVGGEVLWWKIISALNYFDVPYPWLNVVSSSIFFSGVHVLAKKQPDRLAFLILLFPVLIINIPMSGIRQGAAIGLMCISFSAFADRKTLAFVVFTLIAGTLHSSAFLFLLFAPLARGGLTVSRIVMAALVAMPLALLMLGSEASDRAVSRYVNTGVDAYGAVFRVGMLALTASVFFTSLRTGWKGEYPSDYRLVLVFSAAMLALVAALPISTVIADRLGYYLVPVQAATLARLPNLKSFPRADVYTRLAYASLISVLLVWTITSSLFHQCYEPYRTWLFGVSGLGS